MTVPTWPSGVPYESLKDGFSIQPWSANAITTQMEGGNTRSRRRPGDNVATVKQSVQMSLAELETFKTWFASTIGGGAGRFSMNVWTGSEYENKVCQFDLSQPISYDYLTTEVVNVTMQLRVYGI